MSGTAKRRTLKCAFVFALVDSVESVVVENVVDVIPAFFFAHIERMEGGTLEVDSVETGELAGH